MTCYLTTAITSTQDLAQAHFLAKNGVLITVENEANTFTMSSPLLRSVILRYVLPDIFKYCPSIEDRCIQIRDVRLLKQFGSGSKPD